MAQVRRFLQRLFWSFRGGRAETDLAREVRAHLQLLEDQFIAQGMSAEDARYAARRAFGGVEQVKEHQRDTRSFRWLGGASLDFKLGFRMLIKYPGLTLVGGVAIALGIAVGAAAFEFLTQALTPVLPLDEGDRIVAIENWDTDERKEERRALYDFVTWREQLSAIEDLGAFRTIARNLNASDSGGEPIEIAEISASAFRLARVAPLLGRSLMPADERPGAAPVLVIGHGLWQARFAGDPAVIGRRVRLGDEPAEVVGVMPAGFGFPIAHSAWIPLQVGAAGHAPRTGPPILVFGRLAQGVGHDEAQAALDVMAARAAAASPATHAHLRARIRPYAEPDFDEMGLGAAGFNAFALMFVLLVCANVASLVLARAATRESEILVRSALGASRGRIVTQLFIESLVLGGVAAFVGLLFAGAGLRWLLTMLEADSGRPLPFWFSSSLSWTTVLYAVLLTLVGAAVAGAIPAFKITRGIGTRLRQATAAAQGVGFGGVWTAVVITQVAVTVTFPATAFLMRRSVIELQRFDVGFPSEQFLSARLESDAPPPVQPKPVGEGGKPQSGEGGFAELERRLAAEPGVLGVTFANRLPRTYHPHVPIELDGVDGAATAIVPRVASAHVGINYFAVLGAPMLAGRAFHSGDLGTRAVVVNRTFISRVLGGANAIGRRVRYMSPADSREQAWYEIVGVVKDLGMIGGDSGDDGAGVYHPAAPGAGSAARLAVHVAGDAASFAPRLRAVAGALDPTLRLYEVQPLNQVGSSMWLEFQFLYRLLFIVSGIALLLSLTGIYSVLSFTVSRRTREIGIRIALGADARRIVGAIFSRALAQVGLGIAAGGCVVFVLTKVMSGLSVGEAAMVVAYMGVMMAVCVLACIVPTRRALRVEPTEALRAEI